MNLITLWINKNESSSCRESSIQTKSGLCGGELSISRPSAYVFRQKFKALQEECTLGNVVNHLMLK